MIQFPTQTCENGLYLSLKDYDNNNTYEKGFVSDCYFQDKTEFNVQENYNIKPYPGSYVVSLVSGSLENYDCIYHLIEVETESRVAKITFIKSNFLIIIDPILKPDEHNGLIENVDNYFTYSISKHGIINLQKKQDFSVQNITLSDINGTVIFNIQADNHSFIIDLTTQPQGIYFIEILSSEGFLKKKILLVKE